MSTFENEGYKWRETYFVMFDSGRRPSLEAIKEALGGLSTRFELANIAEDDEGQFESLTLHSPQDYAALDISYIAGAEVLEQGATLASELKPLAADATERANLARLAKCDARFDILHFEQVVAAPAEDDLDEMLDPSTLLIALDALVDLTDGIGVDPQSGTMM